MRRKGLSPEVLQGSDAETVPAERTRNAQLSIDYPERGEEVRRGHYAVRISGCEGECHIAIDDTGGWQTCRTADGFYWFDWNPQHAGSYEILVRARLGDKWVRTQRTCRVV